MTDVLDRIVVDPAILTGKPIIRGTRMSVEHVLDHLAEGWTVSDILDSYPQLVKDDVIACIAYARDVVRSERVFPSAA